MGTACCYDGVCALYKFTGKERDTETGFDYFGARYYGSNMGRFLSADWSAKAEPVPYAKLYDPQTLNLYAYVGNNPLSRADLDGHCWFGRWGSDCKPKTPPTPDPANVRNPNSATSPETAGANPNYKMVVTRDGGGKKADLAKSQNNGREVTYVLQDANGNKVTAPGGSIVVTEHLSKPIGSGHANNSEDGKGAWSNSRHL